MPELPVVLLAFANDRGGGHGYLRNLPEEARQVREVLARAEASGLCEVVFLPNVTVAEVLDLFQSAQYRNRIAIFHFGGHAGSHELLFESREGPGASANAQSLAEFLGQQRGIRLVFLNGCSTAQQVEGLLNAGVASVIATSQAIDDAVATDFSMRFYSGLVGGASIETAYSEADAAARTVRSDVTRSGTMRDLYRTEVAGKPVPETLVDSSPWRLRCREGAEAVREWNLPDAADDPLYALPALPPLDLPEAPFRNILWFGRSDAPIFFGRGYEIRELYQKLTAPDGSPVILYYGQSGVGKSSLLAAGLLPRLEQVQHVAYARREDAVGLLGTLAATLAAEGAHLQLAPLPTDVAADPAATGESLRQLWLQIEQQSGKPLTLLLDQVEESYTRPRAAEPDELERLAGALGALFINRETRPQGRLVLSFRKEWLAELEKLLTSHQIPRARLYLERLGRRGVIEAVAGPAHEGPLKRKYNLSVEEGLADQIASDLLADPSSAVAPTLQILLDKMWQAAKKRSFDNPTFDGALYDELKRKGLLLEDFLREQMQALDAAQHALVASGLALDLLAYHTTALGTAEERALAAVKSEYAHRAGDVEWLLQACRDLYLLVDPRANMPDAAPASRLAHDTLAPLVRQRYEHSDAPGQRARRIVENRGVEWQGDKTGATLDDDDIALVEAGRDGMRMLTADEQRMLEASAAELQAHMQKVEQDKRALEMAVADKAAASRRTRMMTGAVLLTVAVAAVIGYLLWQTSVARDAAETEKTIAQSAKATAVAARMTAEIDRGLAVEAQATAVAAKAEVERLARDIRADKLSLNALELVDEDPPLALLLGVESLREQNDILRSEPAVLSRITYDFTGAAYVTSTSVLTFEAVGGSVLGRTYQLLQRDMGNPLAGHAVSVDAIAFSPNGRWLATRAWGNNNALLWDLMAADPGAAPVVLPGQEESSTAIAFSPDGRWLATGSANHTARLWNLEATDPSAEPAELTGHAAPVNVIAFSPDARWLATGSSFNDPVDTTVRLWKLDADNADATSFVLTGHMEGVQVIYFSPDGRWLATGSNVDALLWNLEAADPSVAPIVLTGNTNIVNAIAFSPDGRWLATGSEDNTARLWDLDAADPGAESLELTGHTKTITAITFSPDGLWLATGSGDNTARLWNLEAADPSAESFELTGHTDTITAIAFSPDGQWVATGSLDGTARLTPHFDAEPIVLTGLAQPIDAIAFSFDGRWFTTKGLTRAYLWDLKAASPSATPIIFAGNTDIINAIAFSPDGRWLATGSEKDTARLWDLEAASPSATPVVLAGNTNSVDAIAFSPDGRWLARRSSDNTARLWDLDAANPGAAPVVLTGHTEDINAVAFSPDGQWLATGSDDDSVRLWDLDAANLGARSIELTGHAGDITAAAFSPDGRWLATGSEDSTARLWDLEATDPSAAPVLRTGYTNIVNAIAFSPDGRWLATGSYAGALLWDLKAADPSAASIELAGHRASASAMAFSPNGRWLVTGLYADALLWDLKAADPSAADIEIKGHTGIIKAIAFSPDGRWLATGSEDNTARLWDLDAADPGAAPFVFTGHTGDIVVVAFSPDGRWLATGSYDGTARLWDLSTADPRKAPIIFAEPGWFVTFSPDGRWLATTYVDVKLTSFREPDELIQLICQRTGRNLTSEEWRTYLGDQPDRPYRATCLQWPFANEDPVRTRS